MRLSGGVFRTKGEQAALSDRATVQRWLREMRPEQQVQVWVHRAWGTIAAVADRNESVGVFLSDGKNSWMAHAPGAPDDQPLTPGQVEHVMLDALTAPGRPAWADWRET